MDDLETRLAKVLAKHNRAIDPKHLNFPVWTTHEVEEEVLAVMAWVLEELEKEA